MLEPWLHWQQRERQGNWFALYKESSSDLLMVGALQGGVWVDPERHAKSLPQSPTQLTVSRDGDNLNLGFSLQYGRRKWMLAALDKAQSLPSFAAGQNYYDEYRAPLPQQYLIKHGDFPLDMVKVQQRNGAPSDFHDGWQRRFRHRLGHSEAVTNVRVGEHVVLHCGMCDVNAPFIKAIGGPIISVSNRIWGYETS